MSALTEEDKAKYIPVIDGILKASDLSTISIKQVRTRLSGATGVDFTSIKKAIDPLITDRFDILLAERDNPPALPVAEQVPLQHIGQLPDGDSNGADVRVKPEVKEEETEEGMSPPDMKRKSSSVDEDARLAAELHAELNGGRPVRGGAAKPKKASAVKGKRANAKKKSKDIVDSDLSGAEEPVKKKRKANPNNAFMRPLVLSAPLAAFIGEPQMSRPEVVKKIWAYVKLNNLQDPTDRRYIICDDSLKPVFGDKVHMFTMNKVLATNMYKAEEVAPTAPDSSPGSLQQPV